MSLKTQYLFWIFLLNLILTSPIYSQGKEFINDSTAFEEEFIKHQNAFDEDYTKAKNYYSKALLDLDTLSRKHPNTIYFLKRKADVLNKLGLADIKSGDFENAIIRFNSSINIRDAYNEPNDAASTYYLKGIVWLRQGNFDRAKTNYDSAYVMTERNIAKGLPHHSFKATLLNLYGAHYANLDSINKAEFYFKKAIRFADSLGDNSISAMNRIQYAEVLNSKARDTEALKLQEEAYNNYLELGYEDGKMGALSEMATSYNALGNYAEAYTLKKQFIEYLKSTGQNDRLMLEFPFFIEIIEKNKKYKEGFREQEAFISLKDSLRNAEKYRELADLDAKLKYETQKSIDSLHIISERKIVEVQQAEKANTQFWVMVSAFLLILAVIALLYIRNRQKIKEQAYQNILLNNKVATKTEEINELLTETIQHIKSKERIAENLQKLVEEDGAINIKSIIADINSKKSDDSKLLLVKENIEKVNFDFIKRLSTEFPELTKTDIEICSFLKIGLDRNQIAQLRNTSIEAVRKSRHRIRKKMKLEDHVNLQEYLSNM